MVCLGHPDLRTSALEQAATCRNARTQGRSEGEEGNAKAQRRKDAEKKKKKGRWKKGTRKG
jgi:hypothetical protein